MKTLLVAYLHVVFPVINIFLYSTIGQKCALCNGFMEWELQSTTDDLAIEKIKPLTSSFILLFVAAEGLFTHTQVYASFLIG